MPRFPTDMRAGCFRSSGLSYPKPSGFLSGRFLFSSPPAARAGSPAHAAGCFPGKAEETAAEREFSAVFC
ncbi:MAG: hypothetical protein CW338_01055 [Clostridiales bacterium]|nr:hypothetical protein [Clostridiales bacterium]